MLRIIVGGIAFRRVTAAAALVAALIAGEARARSQRLYAAHGGTLVELETDPARLGQVRRAWTLPIPPGVTPRDMIVGGAGRYIVWVPSLTASDLAIFDTVSGDLVTRTVGDVTALNVIGVDEDGDELVLRVTDVTGATRVATGTARDDQVRLVSPPLTCPRAFAFAPGRRQVLVLRLVSCAFGPPPPQWVDVVDLDTGAVRERAIDVPFSTRQAIAVDAAGSRLWVAAAAGYGYLAEYAAFDVATGAVLGVNTAVFPEPYNRFAPSLIVDAASGVLLTVTDRGLSSRSAPRLDGETSASSRLTRTPSSSRTCDRAFTTCVCEL